MRLDQIGLQGNRPAQRGNSLFGPVLLMKHAPETAISLGVVRPETDGFSVGGNRFFKIALGAQRQAEIGIGFRAARHVPDRLPASGDRLTMACLVRRAAHRAPYGRRHDLA